MEKENQQINKEIEEIMEEFEKWLDTFRCDCTREVQNCCVIAKDGGIRPDVLWKLRHALQDRDTYWLKKIEEIEGLKVFTDYPNTPEDNQMKYENGLFNSALDKVLEILKKDY